MMFYSFYIFYSLTSTIYFSLTSIGIKISARILTRRLTTVNLDFKQTMQTAALLSGTQRGDSSMSEDCLSSAVTETCTSCHSAMKFSNQGDAQTFFFEPQQHCRMKKCAKDVAGGLDVSKKRKQGLKIIFIDIKEAAQNIKCTKLSKNPKDDATRSRCVSYFHFLFLGWHTLSSHVSTEAGLPHRLAQCATPGKEGTSGVARHHQANLMVCVVVARPLLIERCVGLREGSGVQRP